jgi:hypothetical protein
MARKILNVIEILALLQPELLPKVGQAYSEVVREFCQNGQ